MDSEESPEKRLHMVVRDLMVAYVAIAGLLKLLPIPVTLPITGVGARDRLLAVQQARELVMEEPADELLKAITSEMLLEWLTAIDMATLAKFHGNSPWRLDAAEAAYSRMIAHSDAAAALLLADQEE